MNKKDILNLEKGYELDAVWSEFNEVHRLGITRKMGWKWGWFCLRFGVDIICFFSFPFWLLSILLGSRGQSELYTFWHKYNFFFCNFTMFFCRWVNDETCLNVKSSRILEKGTFECGNVGFSVKLTELNIVNHHSNYYIVSSLSCTLGTYPATGTVAK